MKVYSDGWHVVAGWRVYVENGRILRGVKKDHNGNDVTAYPYRAAPGGGWDSCSGITPDAFRALCRRERGKLA